MAGMYYRRLNGRDSAGATDGVRVVEDVSAGVTWTVHEDTAAVEYHLPEPTVPPWRASDSALPATVVSLTVLPRIYVSDGDLAVVRALRTHGAASAVVHRVSAELRRAWLRLPDGLTATVVAADVGSQAVLVLPHVLTLEQQVTGTVKAVTMHRGAPQIQLDLRNLDTPSLWQQLDDAGVREGMVLTGRVRNAPDSVGVFVEVLPGFNGLIRARDLAPGRPPSSYERGTELTVCVDAIHEDPKRPGFPAFNLSLEW